MPDDLNTVSENVCFGGVQGVYSHRSKVCNCDMTFGLFLPSAAKHRNVPVVWYLSGLTCTHENAMVKAGAQAHAERLGLALVFPDTSPRGEDVANDDAYDLGQGAGFYVNSTQEPWAQHFRMWDYVVNELPELVGGQFNLDMTRQGITGHSMGGHGALTIAMTHPEKFKSVSAFSPICNPTQSDWGKKQLSAYLGDDEENWRKHDASILMEENGFDGHVLIDTGTEDQFSELLKTEAMATAIANRRQSASLRLQPGYDHSYFFVSTFMADHLEHHANELAKG